MTLAPVPPASLVTRSAVEVAAAWLLGYGESTRREYARDLRQWGDWLARYDVDPLDAQRAHVDAYARALEAAGRKPATVARKLAALSAFYRYAADEGAVAKAPTSGVRRPRVDDESTTLGLDADEASALLASARRSGPRDYALTCLLALNGLRIGEAVSANIEDLTYRRGRRALKIARKGGKVRVVPLADATAQAIAAALGDRDTGPLFLNRSGGRLSRQGAWKLVRRIGAQAGLARPVSPHPLRHTFVTVALDEGAELHHVQDAASHADPRTTQRYNRARDNVDRHPTHAVARRLLGNDERPPAH